MGIDVQQSIPLCLFLSAVGGIIEVFATSVLAYQDARERHDGEKWSVAASRTALALNVTLQVASSVLGNLFAPWYGPVSIVGPVFLSAQLVANMAVFGSFLGLESFTKDMRVGTYVVVTAVIMLPVVGPAAQEGQDVMALLTTWWALVWSAIIVVGMIVSCALIVTLEVRSLLQSKRIAILLVARATAFAVNLTVSRIFVLGPTPAVFAVSLALKLSSGAIMTHALVVQATAVEQAVFVPLNASALILVNAMTGMIIWEDWRVIGSWVGYVCIFVQLVLGNYLLLGDVEMLRPDNTKYGAVKSVKMVLKPRRGKRNFPMDTVDSVDRDTKGNEIGAAGYVDGVCMRQLSTVTEESADENSSYVKFDDGDDKGDPISGPELSLRPPSSLSREPRRRSSMRQAWSVVYGLDDDKSRGGKHRRRSIFVMEDTAAEELASLRQII